MSGLAQTKIGSQCVRVSRQNSFSARICYRNCYKVNVMSEVAFGSTLRDFINRCTKI